FAREVGMARRGIPYYERLRRLRQNPRAGYPFACACVLLSSIIQWSFRDLLAIESFGAFYLAVILSTLVGGAGPGALATVLSGVAQPYIFLPLPLSFTLSKGSAVAHAVLRRGGSRRDFDQRDESRGRRAVDAARERAAGRRIRADRRGRRQYRR